MILIGWYRIMLCGGERLQLKHLCQAFLSFSSLPFSLPFFHFSPETPDAPASPYIPIPAMHCNRENSRKQFQLLIIVLITKLGHYFWSPIEEKYLGTTRSGIFGSGPFFAQSLTLKTTRKRLPRIFIIAIT